jgi:hypothetical protein
LNVHEKEKRFSNSSKIPKSTKVEDVFEEPIIEEYDDTHHKHQPNRGTLNNDELE